MLSARSAKKILSLCEAPGPRASGPRVLLYVSIRFCSILFDLSREARSDCFVWLPLQASQRSQNILYCLREPPGWRHNTTYIETIQKISRKIFYTTSASLPATLPILLLTRDHGTTGPRAPKIADLSNGLAEKEKTCSEIISFEKVWYIRPDHERSTKSEAGLQMPSPKAI